MVYMHTYVHATPIYVYPDPAQMCMHVLKTYIDIDCIMSCIELYLVHWCVHVVIHYVCIALILALFTLTNGRIKHAIVKPHTIYRGGFHIRTSKCVY